MNKDSRATHNQPTDYSNRLNLLTRLSLRLKSGAKRALPKGLVAEFRRMHSLSMKERIIYLRIRVLDKLRLHNRDSSRLAKSARSVLFVCFGNIMRSPMCEALMNQALAAIPHATVQVASAGVNAVAGRPAHPWAIAAACEFGVSLADHRARPLTREMLERADVIFVMDYQNQAQIIARYPEVSRKVMMLSAYAGLDYPFAEIRDPYYEDQGGTRRCYQVLQACIRNLVSDLLAQADGAAPGRIS